ncbi:MAG: xanthine dehydrogenase accessory protein XdhC, partial [Marinosulfonomonas sp.]|nr:xanthine dehydrogenase accessory protein XdhC [Marinosulfonomonas sp.]
MTFDLDELRATVKAHGPVSRIVVAATQGSVPREIGASMLVWAGGQSGTIGGGRLEWDAVRTAKETAAPKDRVQLFPLGPALGQCCGGTVMLLTEHFDPTRINDIDEQYFMRRIRGSEDAPLNLKRLLATSRNSGQTVGPILDGGWFLEPVLKPTRPIWVYGAGHVGRAIVQVLAPFPEITITWVDTAADRFPDDIPDKVTTLIAANPAETAKYAPANAEHLILTYSHTIDLELCHQLLGRDFASVGLIGSKTKWARFRSRLGQLGHGGAQISRITCPIGQPEFGKHPQAIAVSVAAALLSVAGKKESIKDRVG